jgi:hypothetical protein
LKDLVPYIVDRLKKANARHDIHSFPSGALMIDIWIDSKFYVIQIFEDTIGLSLITEHTAVFDTIPDKTFTIENEFKAAFESIFL